MRGIHGYSEALSGAVKSLDPNPMNDKLTDHARGCQGREYVCTCGYDDQIDTNITQLSTLYSNAIARAEKAEEALRKSEWQLAKNAPVETMVLVCDVNWPASLQRDQPAPIKVGYLDASMGTWKIFGASWRPTHFMPLPPPPVRETP